MSNNVISTYPLSINNSSIFYLNYLFSYSVLSFSLKAHNSSTVKLIMSVVVQTSISYIIARSSQTSFSLLLINIYVSRPYIPSSCFFQANSKINNIVWGFCVSCNKIFLLNAFKQRIKGLHIQYKVEGILLEELMLWSQFAFFSTHIFHSHFIRKSRTNHPYLPSGFSRVVKTLITHAIAR